jgi:Pyridoxamine 5'-phosphate oxidase
VNRDIPSRGRSACWERRRGGSQYQVSRALNDGPAQELLKSSIPVRLAYTALDGSPRVVSLGFHWDGEWFVIRTIPGSPKVRALEANPNVAMTIDTQWFPPHILLVRGTATLRLVDGVPAQYLAASRKQVGAEGMPAFEAQVRALYDQTVRIDVEPHWAKLIDFETTPSASVFVGIKCGLNRIRLARDPFRAGCRWRTTGGSYLVDSRSLGAPHCSRPPPSLPMG